MESVKVLEAYRVLTQAYPGLSGMHGSSKLRMLARLMRDEQDVQRALNLVTDTEVRARIRERIAPMLSFPLPE